MEIIRGTTPTFIFTFATIDPTEITSAFFTMKQMGKVKVSKPLSDAVVKEHQLEWTITQEESLTLVAGTPSAGKPCEVFCDWVVNDELRGGSKIVLCDVLPTGKDEVI